ncbi:MAG: hypothetical protein PWP15_981 [Methanothermococcus sp.]|jgi:queuine/archaeosine tRNA-ribosyltransferase|uniref:tRNA-guanine transglycosylase DpdA n=1 Tax=Methanothermococcus TaxID=155862 RepID=UPI00037E04EA|nr:MULTISPECIES: tRNA-guanine transglycosylase DpdA [Methanothermococcus]MDK2790474.1 hypothetical protein [Methanothermococcus sp.]MDK2987614.1 hypothetical protein [Methanothermococcus sp.]
MIKYFLPDWEDRVDPNFDFINDEYSEGHKQDIYNNDVYAHQIFKEPPYDGILFSLSVFQSKISLNSNKGIYKIRNHTNIKEYLKIPKSSSLEVMGDCGAFGYVNEKEPPLPFYSVENVSKLYDKLGFDYGVAPDHLVVDKITIKDDNGKKKRVSLTQKEKDDRISITLENAEKFLKLHHKKKYNYIPIGTAQGYNVETYRSSVKALVDMGYNYIALGSLVCYKTNTILNILQGIQPVINEDIKIHLFGVVRLNALKKFEELGVKSVDSTSFLRKAWLRSGQNYITKEGNGYAAIRVPQASNPRLLKNANINGYSIENLKKMENEVLCALNKYEKGEISIDEVLDSIMRYDNLFMRNSNDGKNLREKYYKTLIDRPWESCECPICKELGIQVIIFRGTNRNKRRGFHNIWVLRQLMKKELSTNISINAQSTLDEFSQIHGID